MAGQSDETITAAFDPDEFRKLGHLFVDQLADALGKTKNGDCLVRDPQSAQDAFEFWDQKLENDLSPDDLLAEVLKRGFRGHHPNNLGHQVGPALPLAALGELAGSLLDTGNGVFEVGNPATPMERVVLKNLAEKMGFPETADGILTSGGSLGNLTALLAMRQCRTGNWDSGFESDKFTILVSEEAHYCMLRAAKIMGWGEKGITKVAVDKDFRMCLIDLSRAYEQAKSDGRKILGVVGSAGSTATGKIDPLPAISEFCRKNDLWFHIDAAHAGAFVYSAEARKMLAGIESADSVVVDFHKMLLSPSLLTAVLFRRAEDSYQSFAQKADYLWREDHTPEWWDGAKRTLECTRPMLGLRAYILLQTGKNALFETYIDNALAMTRKFAELINEADDFELMIEPESNIICYRYSCGENLNQLNADARQAIVDEAKFYIVQVEKKGKIWLRSALMNPFVSEQVILSLMSQIRDHVAQTM